MRLAWTLLVAAWVVPALYSQDAKPPDLPAPAKQEDAPAKQEDLKHRPQPANNGEEEIPPEEDKSLTVTEYSFNPLQAEKELETGSYYFKKGSYRAAASRFREATRWNGGLSDAWLRLGEAEEKLKDHKAAKEAYTKYLTLAADAKNAQEIRKKIAKMK